MVVDRPDVLNIIYCMLRIGVVSRFNCGGEHLKYVVFETFCSPQIAVIATTTVAKNNMALYFRGPCQS